LTKIQYFSYFSLYVISKGLYSLIFGYLSLISAYFALKNWHKGVDDILRKSGVTDETDVFGKLTNVIKNDLHLIYIDKLYFYVFYLLSVTSS